MTRSRLLSSALIRIVQCPPFRRSAHELSGRPTSQARQGRALASSPKITRPSGLPSPPSCQQKATTIPALLDRPLPSRSCILQSRRQGERRYSSSRPLPIGCARPLDRPHQGASARPTMGPLSFRSSAFPTILLGGGTWSRHELARVGVAAMPVLVSRRWSRHGTPAFSVRLSPSLPPASLYSTYMSVLVYTFGQHQASPGSCPTALVDPPSLRAVDPLAASELALAR